MEKPDQRLFESDLASAEFRAGALKGLWGLAGEKVLPEQPAWPLRILWVEAAPRAGAPDRFYLRLDLDGYRTVPPTGTFWDPSTQAALGSEKRTEKGKRTADSPRYSERTGRTDWLSTTPTTGSRSKGMTDG